MLLRLCQLKSQFSVTFMLIILSACSWRSPSTNAPDTASEILSVVNNKWFSTNLNHSLIKSNGEPASHLFFDSALDMKPEERLVNVIMATPQNSDHAYQIDLNSGQKFYSHTFCRQPDVWGKYSGKINRPSFSLGYIPRVLDQTGSPQKVAVWSNRRNFGKSGETIYKVKLVGAYVEQLCPEGNCIGKSNWISRLVFLGIDALDSSLPDVTTVADLPKTIDWEEGKAQLENIEGRNFIGDQTYPYVRVGQLIEFKEAFDYFKKRSIILSDTELKKIQKGCHALYDALWDEVGKFRPEDIGAKTSEEMKAKAKLIEELRKKKLPVGFAARMKAFTQKFYPEISTCEKFVYHGNVNKDPEAFWFLSYMGIYFRLHREGFYFNCSDRTWQRNILNLEGKLVHDLKRDIRDCKDQDFDRAMEYLPNFLTGLKGEREYFKFIEYDNHVHGSHQKMYSWVKMKSRKFDCSNDPNREIRTNTPVFPEDVRWKPRFSQDNTDEKIIY